MYIIYFVVILFFPCAENNYKLNVRHFFPLWGSGWITEVGHVYWVIYPLFRGLATPGDCKPELQLGLRTSFFRFAMLLSIYILSFSSYLFSVSMSYFIIAVPMRKCVWKTSCMSATFLIYSHTEWYLLSSLSGKAIRSGRRVLINYILKWWYIFSKIHSVWKVFCCCGCQHFTSN